MKRVHKDLLIPIVGLLLVLGPSNTAPNVAVAVENPIQFNLSDGDEVTCIPVEQQKSLSNETSPSWNWSPTTQVIPGNSTISTYGSRRAQQTIVLDEGACPDGTIPVRKYRGFSDPDTSRAQKQKRTRWSSPPDQNANLTDSPPHEYGVARLENTNPSTNVKSYYKGTEVTINVWRPYVESSVEFSLAQLWLASTEPVLNTIEVGYQVYPFTYGDDLSRLFVYWTADNYITTGCYNLDCPGFVQVSNKVLLGGSFTSQSRRFGQQYEIKLRVFKDAKTGDWWLKVDDETVGYWPKHLFVGLQGLADDINWGGEIVDDQSYDIGGLHSHTQMGSGEFASRGFRRAAYMRNLQTVDLNDTLVDAPFYLSNTDKYCYSVEKGNVFPQWGSYFYYGGKGYGSKCLTDPTLPLS